MNPTVHPRRVVFLFLLLATGACLLPAAEAAAALQQQALIHVQPTRGAEAAQGRQWVKLSAYLATRDPQSPRGPMRKPNPVGTVTMAFPAGSTVNARPGAARVCQQSEYATPAMLALLCPGAVVGRGWALLNDGNLQPAAHEQITGAPGACAAGDATQYRRAWGARPQNGPDCVPVGDLYVQVIAYQGGLLKSKYWCYGVDAITRPEYTRGKRCYLRAASGDARGQRFNYSGSELNPDYRESLNSCNIIFANLNPLTPLSFGGSVAGCRNQLSVVVPALNGTGSGLGELTAGFVLTDFYLQITSPNYLRSGACPRTRRWTVSSSFTYSKLLGESAAPNPAALTVRSTSACRR